jgi:hypothetical protein
VKLWDANNQIDIRERIRVMTTKLSNMTQIKGIDVEDFIHNIANEPINSSIFELYNKLSRYSNDLQDMCYKYADNNVSKWWQFMEVASDIKKEYDTYICDYNQSMKIDKEVSFPFTSSYQETEQSERIDTWVWCRKD